MTARRRFYRLVSLICALSLLTGLSGCGKDAGDTAAAAGSAAFGQTLQDTAADSMHEATGAVSALAGTFSMPFDSGYGWDPYNCLSMENQAVFQLMYEGLFTMTPDFGYEPVLAESFEVSSTGLMYTIRLKSGVCFSNGQPLTADDVLYSFDQAEDSDLYAARFRTIASWEAEDDLTVVVYLSKADDCVPCLLDFPIVPDRSGTGACIGTGPFARASDSGLVRNQAWWQDGSALSFDRVALCESGSAEETRDAFEIDQVHMVFNNPLTESAAAYHCDYELWNSLGTTMLYLSFNMDQGIFQDEAVRRGVLRAVNRESIADSIYHNYAAPSPLPAPPDTGMYDSELAANYLYNPNEALSLLLSSSSFYLPEDSPLRDGIVIDENGNAAAAVDETDKADEDTESNPNPEENQDATDEETQDETEAQDENAENGGTDANGRSKSSLKGVYNAITLAVCGGNETRLKAAQAVKADLDTVGFTVTIAEYDESEFFYQLNTSEWDICLCEVTMTPDFDPYNVALYGGSFNYGNIPEDSECSSLYYSAMENQGNRYDLYQCILDHGYICPILIENNAVYTIRGVFSGLNPAPGNIFYQIQNIKINR